MYKIVVLEDNEYEYFARTLQSFDALKKELQNLDTYGVGGYSTPNGVQFGTPTWTYKEGLRVLLQTSESWSQLRDGLLAIFGDLAQATPKGVAIESDVDLDEEWTTYVVREEG